MSSVGSESSRKRRDTEKERHLETQSKAGEEKNEREQRGREKKRKEEIEEKKGGRKEIT